MRFIIKKELWLIFLLMIGVLAQKGLADEKARIFTGEGVASIVNENVLAARGEAIKKARLNALEKATEEILPFEVIEEKREIIEAILFSNLKTFILGTKVIREKEEDGLYRVIVRATVDLDALKRTIIDKGLMPKRGLGYRPRIMVVIPEQHFRRQIPDPAAETEIIRQFVKERFYVVDQKQVEKIRYNDKTLAAAQGDSEAAAAIGRKYGAEVIITGEAFSEFVGREKGMVLCSARVEIRAVKTDTAQILYADAVDISALATSENVAAKRALQRAGSLLAPKFIEELLAWAEVSKERGKMVTLYIPNISYSQLMVIKETLAEKIPKVDSSIQRSYTSEIAEVEVIYRGNSQELADAIQKISFEGFNLRVTNFTENRIDCEIVKGAEEIVEKVPPEVKEPSLLPKIFIMKGIWKLTIASVEFLPGKKNLQFNLIIENLQDKPAEYKIETWRPVTYLLDNLGNKYAISNISPPGSDRKTLIQNIPLNVRLIFPELKEKAEAVFLYLYFTGRSPEGAILIHEKEIPFGPIKLTEVPVVKEREGLREISLPQEFMTENGKWKVTIESYELLEGKLEFTLLIENRQEKIAECKIDEHKTYLLDNLANEYHSPSTEGYKKLIPRMPVKFYLTFSDLKEGVEVVVLYLNFKSDDGTETNWAVGPIKLER